MDGDGRSNPVEGALHRSLHRWKVAGVVTLFLLATGSLLSQAVEASDRTTETEGRRTRMLTMGEEVYASSCATCHGDQGQGVDSPALNSREFLTASTEEHVYRLASVGIPGTAMPSWSSDLGGPLTDEQLRAVSAYIMTWLPSAPAVPGWRTRFLGTPPPMPSHQADRAGEPSTTGRPTTKG